MTGLLIMTNMTSTIENTEDNQISFPLSSDITLKDSILENQILKYQTYYQQTLSHALCDEEEDDFINPKYYISNVTQAITFDSNNNMLNVQENVDNKNYKYNVTSASNIPVDTFNYPYNNGWQHNYPKENSEITLNTQEITYLTIYREISLVSTYKFEGPEDLKYGDVIIPTEIFTNSNSNSSSFEIAFGVGWDQILYEATLESKYYFHETSGILIRVETEWHLISVQDEVVWEHWSIEKNLVSINGENLVYTYVPPPAYSESNINWPLITLVVGIVGVSVFLLVLGIKPKKK